MKKQEKTGVLAGGNFITDYVKLIEAWPRQDMLANIVSESMSNGGGPYNVLKDLAALGAAFPLEAAGLLGDDANGQWIRDDCDAHGIDTAQLRTTRSAATSYTDAMCVKSDGRRTFFHQRGANALLAEDDVDLSTSNAKIFFLAYLLLLDSLDRVGADGATGASRLLAQARDFGFITVVDTVSSPDPRFREVVVAAIRHTDIFFTNEIEASLILAQDFGPDAASLESAATQIAAVGSPGRVVVHSALGAVCCEPNGEMLFQASLQLPGNFIKGSTGAGDAFTAGFLLGVHEDRDVAQCLMQGVCAAAASLSHPSPSQGVLRMKDCLALAKRYGFQDFAEASFTEGAAKIGTSQAENVFI